MPKNNLMGGEGGENSLQIPLVADDSKEEHPWPVQTRVRPAPVPTWLAGGQRRVPGAVGQAPALGSATQREAFVAGEPHVRPVGKREPLRSHLCPLDRGLGAANHCGERAEVGLAAARPRGQRGSGSGGAEPLF